MPDKQVRKDFDEMLKSAPTEDEAAPRMTITAAVMQSKDAKTFLARGASGKTAEISRDAVEKFDVLSSAPGERIASMVLNESLLSAETRETLSPQQGGGAFKNPPFDTLKEPSSDTLKEGVFDTLKEVGGPDTLKEVGGPDTLKEASGPDTLKEISGPDTLKEASGPDTLKEIGGSDTLKEIGGGDTRKEGTFDTLKEIGGSDTFKESAGGDTFKETTGDQTLVEQPELPGGGLGQFAQPRAMSPEQAMLAAGTVGGQQFATGMPPNLTLKEVPFDQTFKEIAKDVIMDGTGIMDSLVEGQPDIGQMVNPAIQQAGVPFVLATPHQASQGAVAQQMLAAQALQGRLGF